MPRDDDTKVFDVSKPHRVEPSASSKPVIVGHHPTMADPMVREAFKSHHGQGPKIEVKGDDDTEPEKIETSHHPFEHSPLATESFSHHDPQPHDHHSGFDFSQHHEPEHDTDDYKADTEPVHADDHKEPEPPYKIEMPGSDEDGLYHTDNGHEHSSSPLFSDDSSDSDEDEHDSKPGHSFSMPKSPGAGHHSLFGGKKDDENVLHPVVKNEDWVEPSPLRIPQGAGPYRRWPKIISWILVLALLVAIAGFLAIDAGIVKSDMKLPFHIFNKQKMATVVTPPPPPPPAVVTPPAPVLPQGFVKYQVPNTTLSFAYPTAWGTPTTTNDPGFSQRSTKAKADGIYAYVVNFATNKNVQITFSSSKYLFSHPDVHYYDFLRWCVGTNDGKFYKESLHFNSTAGTDTPSTVVCDKGPLDTAVKVDATTIMQPKYKESPKDPTGDLYTKNLKSTDVTVMRVMDQAMTNGPQIKQLIGTVKEVNQ